ncbi:hypothetical protein B0H10DRAFT_2206699 [Mycena sp. CBHHK59/15]|nr:hypothetical protein B0H10DRAFT_2206699 [Mycena sp. CBHHK59/15]
MSSSVARERERAPHHNPRTFSPPGYHFHLRNPPPSARRLRAGVRNEWASTTDEVAVVIPIAIPDDSHPHPGLQTQQAPQPL